MKYLILLLTALGAAGSLLAQHQEIGEQPSIWKEKKSLADSTSLLHAFRNGNMSGHLRYFLMATDNEKMLSDYIANAAGGGIKFETAPLKGFQLGISGFFTFNVGSSNLAIPDPITNVFNRYEIGLFDQEDPNNKTDIDRLEELYLKYSFKKNTITLGKQLINTPFINLQDGRMRPTEVSGIWAQINSIPLWKIEGGIINQISPRGTVKWFRVKESIGIYPSGFNTDGSKSNYKEYTETKGIGSVGISHQLNSNWNLKFWDLYVENIFNASMLQIDWKKTFPNDHRFLFGMQSILQQKIGNGGNEDISKRYMQENGSFTFGAMAGWEHQSWKSSINFNRITNKGRYLMPREWGRDPFYTFMARERNEGLADATAWVAKLGYQFNKSKLSINSAFGIFALPPADDSKKNKYAMPSYNQFNVDLRYDLKGFFSGTNIQLLYYYKSNSSSQPIPQKFIINKVNMHGWNLVINYNF